MIIDCHVHIGKTEKLQGRHVTIDTYSKIMDGAGVDKAAIMPNVSDVVRSSVLNSGLLDAYNRCDNKSRFYPLLMADPRDIKTLYQIIEHKSEICGVKYHPSVSNCELTDESMRQFVGIVREFGLPMLVHCGRHWRSHISYTLKVARENPKITFIAAHLGGNAINQAVESINMVKNAKLSNVFMDTSSIKQPWLIELALKNLGPYKLLFGSDEPYADLRINKLCVELIDASEEDKEEIYYKNFERIFVS